METADNPSRVEVVAYIDDDDGSYDELIKKPRPRMKLIKGPRLTLSEEWNACWRKATGDIYGHMGDDIIFRTQGWDSAIREAIEARPGNICFAWCNDVSPESQRNHFGTHGFIHRNWTGVTGRFVPPYFVSDYNDTWFNDVGEALNVRTYLHEYLTEHMHFSLGKSEIDQNTRERLDRHAAEDPEKIYNSEEKQLERAQEVEKLREFIKEAQDESA